MEGGGLETTEGSDGTEEEEQSCSVELGGDDGLERRGAKRVGKGGKGSGEWRSRRQAKAQRRGGVGGEGRSRGGLRPSGEGATARAERSGSKGRRKGSSREDGKRCRVRRTGAGWEEWRRAEAGGWQGYVTGGAGGGERQSVREGYGSKRGRAERARSCGRSVKRRETSSS